MCTRVPRSDNDRKCVPTRASRKNIFNNGYDAGLALVHALRVLLSRRLALRIFTGSRTLFESIVTLRSTTEKRLLIDIAGLREVYRNGELKNLAWIRSEHNIADALTKHEKVSALRRMLLSGTLRTPVEQWIAEGKIPKRQHQPYA